jgi:hypothetical protein
MRWNLLVTFALLAALAACDNTNTLTGPPVTEEGDPVPHVLALSSSKVTLGETMLVAGSNFMEIDEGRTILHFEGTFLRDDGIAEATSFTITPLFDGTFLTDGTVGGQAVPQGSCLLRISRFGPFAVPFTIDGNKTGSFRGRLLTTNITKDGKTYEDPDPPEVIIEVDRSIAIRTFEPFLGLDSQGSPKMADCGAPALRAIQGLPYTLEVEAVGFDPEFFIYEFAGINGSEQIKSYTHRAKGKADDIGSPFAELREPIIFNPVPEGEKYYVAAIRIQATLPDGEFVETAFPITVHRPMEFNLSMKAAQPAQYYEPVPVSGCIPGSINNVVSYQETHSEARQRGVSVTVNQSWNKSHADSSSSNWSNGISESSTVTSGHTQSELHSESETSGEVYGVTYNSSEQNSASFSSSDGESWGWSLSEGTSNTDMESDTKAVYGEVSGSVTTEVAGEGSVPGFAKVSGKVGTTVGATAGGSSAGTTGSTTGSSSSHGSSMSGSSSESQSFGSVTTDSKGESLSNSYALGTIDEIGSSTSQSEANSESVTYNFGEGASQTDVVQVGNSESWTETWITTESDSTLMSYAAKIPNKRYGVWYRQAVRYVRKGQVYTYDACGVRELMGETYFNTWAWSPALAIGDECAGNVMPEPDLPVAQCVVPPCD